MRILFLVLFASLVSTVALAGRSRDGLVLVPPGPPRVWAFGDDVSAVKLPKLPDALAGDCLRVVAGSEASWLTCEAAACFESVCDPARCSTGSPAPSAAACDRTYGVNGVIE